MRLPDNTYPGGTEEATVVHGLGAPDHNMSRTGRSIPSREALPATRGRTRQ